MTLEEELNYTVQQYNLLVSKKDDPVLIKYPYDIEQYSAKANNVVLEVLAEHKMKISKRLRKYLGQRKKDDV